MPDDAVNDVFGDGLKNMIKRVIQHRKEMSIEDQVESVYQEASHISGGDPEQIAKALYQASEKAHQDKNELLSDALLERALILALPFILEDDELGEAEHGETP